MTPLEITLLMNLYTSPSPAVQYMSHQRQAPAMKQTFKKFRDLGLLSPGVTYETVMLEMEDADCHLTAKGMLLVERLMEVQP